MNRNKEIIRKNKIENLLKILKEKVILKKIEEQKSKSNKFNYKNIQNINLSFFYDSWKNSFDTEPYRQTKQFSEFIVKAKIPSLKDIKNYLLNNLLKDFQVDIFGEEPGQFEDKINVIIEHYYQ